MSYVSGTVLNQIAFNGSVLITQPSTHGWNQRDSVGIDGNGVEVYVAPREYSLKFDLLDTDEFNQIYTLFLAQGVTGSLVSTLPKWNASPYQWYQYSGTIIREPTYEGYFQNYYQNVYLLVVRITGT